MGLMSVNLDVGGHYAYGQSRGDSFTDSMGLRSGHNDIHSSIVGASARLTGYYNTPSGMVMPYLLLAVDQDCLLLT
jgi:hypothetical protein